VPLLAALPGVQVAPAKGGMYAFFRLEGFGDSLDVAKRLVAEAGLGLAPGNAFAPEAQGWLRWCFASKDPQRLVQGVERLRNWLAEQPQRKADPGPARCRRSLRWWRCWPARAAGALSARQHRAGDGGVLAISWPGEGAAGDSKSPAAMVGNLLVLGAVVCEAMFILLNKRLRVPVRPLALSTLMTAFGLLLSLVPALFERAWEHPVPTAALAGVAYYALVPTVLGFVLWFAGSARLRGAEAALFTAVLPVSALVLAASGWWKGSKGEAESP
jgi:hypothetical protein